MKTKKRPLRIALYVHNLETLPPKETILAHYTITKMLADGMAERGHDVTLFAPKGSKTKAKLVSFGIPSLYESRYRRRFTRTSDPEYTIFELFYQNYFVGEMVKFIRNRKPKFDLIHLHSVQHMAHLSKLLSENFLCTLHDPVDPAVHAMLELYKKQKNFHVVTISDKQRMEGTDLPWLGTVHNGINVSGYTISTKPGKHIMFAGRISEEKGPHRAIAAAKEAGVPIRLFGPYNSHGVYKTIFWKRQIEPHLGKDVEHGGFVSQEALSRHYGSARGLLMPISWEEPFGLVSIEAMACGTPVIGYRRGSLPEIIKDGVTGFLVDNVEEMAEAINQLDTIDRRACREHVEQNFSVKRMLDNYEDVYYEAIARR